MPKVGREVWIKVASVQQQQQQQQQQQSTTTTTAISKEGWNSAQKLKIALFFADKVGDFFFWK